MTMGDKIGPDDPCPCGSGRKHGDCCGAAGGRVAYMRPKDLRHLEWTPGLGEKLAKSLDRSYLEYFGAVVSGGSREEGRRRIAALPEERRYLTRVLDSLDGAFADFDTETARLDLPHMKDRQPEAIQRYLGIRLKQLTLLAEAVDDHIESRRRATGGCA
jgi:hypothetical protein